MANKLEARIKRLEEIIERASKNDPLIIELVRFQDGELSGYRDESGNQTMRKPGETDSALIDRAQTEAIEHGAIRNGLCILSQLRTAN